MSSAKVQGIQRGQGPDIVLALRESLLEDPRLGRGKGHRVGPSDRPIQTGPKEIRQAPGAAVAKPATDQAPPQANLRYERIADGSPTIAPAQPLIEQNPQQSSSPRGAITNDKPSAARRALHRVARGLLTVAVIGAAFAIVSYGNDKDGVVFRAWNLSQSWLSSILRTNSSHLRTNSSQGSSLRVTAISGTAEEASTQNTATPLVSPGAQSTPAATPVESPAELQHQFAILSSDLAVARNIIEQLTARQDQMTRDLATLQSDEQNLSQKIASLPKFYTVHKPRKKVVPSLGQNPEQR